MAMPSIWSSGLFIIAILFFVATVCLYSVEDGAARTGLTVCICLLLAAIFITLRDIAGKL